MAGDTHTGHRAGKEQEKGRSGCQAHASLECRWECREGWHGSSWRRPEQTPAWPCQLLCHIPSPERQLLTRNQPSNPKKTDSNPKENTGDRARPCWIPSLWSRILEKGDERPHRAESIPHRVCLSWCPSVHPTGNGVGAAPGRTLLMGMLITNCIPKLWHGNSLCSWSWDQSRWLSWIRVTHPLLGYLRFWLSASSTVV